MARAVEYADCRGVRPLNECPGYDTKPSDGEAPGLELWGMWTTPSLPLVPSPPWTGMLVPDRVPCMGQIKLFGYLTVYKQMTYVKFDYVT